MKFIIYRRRPKSDCWHFVPTCQHWPVFPRSKYVEQAKKPTTGELCDECISKTKRAKVRQA